MDKTTPSLRGPPGAGDDGRVEEPRCARSDRSVSARRRTVRRVVEEVDAVEEEQLDSNRRDREAREDGHPEQEECVALLAPRRDHPQRNRDTQQDAPRTAPLVPGYAARERAVDG